MKKPVSSLLPALEGYELLPPAGQHPTRLSPPPLSFEITALCYDSRKAVDTCLFFCLTGAMSDGHDYALSAYRAGVRFFVVSHRVDLPDDALQICVPNTRLALADASGAFYDHPDRAMRLIGLTGTKGKTTTAGLIAAMLNENGIPTGYIGTNGIDFAGMHFPTVNSTPESLEIAHYLRYMLDMGVRTCVMEVSSQALWTYRVRGLSFDICLFTNLSPDHIGGYEHPDFDHYRSCKHRLFTDFHPRMVIANADDPHALWMMRDVTAPIVWFGTRKTFTRHPKTPTDTPISAGNSGHAPTAGQVSTAGQAAPAASARPRLSWIAADIAPKMDGDRPGTTFSCAHGGMIFGNSHFLPLPGAFNVQNALGALAVVCEGFGIAPERALNCLHGVSVPGRFETLTSPDQPGVTYVIDYAHNGVSLAAILDALRTYQPARIICLFGSVGGRTFTRRKDLAEAAATRADLCILTADNPGSEPAENTIRDIDAHFPPGSCPRLLIPDRADAIREAVRLAQPGDFVLLAGKGHEDYQLIGNDRVPFCEREIVRLAIQERKAAMV